MRDQVSEDTEDKVRLEDDLGKKFEIKCLKCGSTRCETDSDVYVYDSCSGGNVYIECLDCGAREDLYGD